MTTANTTPPQKKTGGVQPKHHAPKGKLLTSFRHRKIIEAAIEGKSMRETGIALGYSPKTVDSQVSGILKRPEVQDTFARILEQSGLSDQFLAEKIRTLANAETKQYAQLDGQFTDERTQPAWETQRKTAELVCRLKGHLKERPETDISVGLMQIVVQQIAETTS